MRVILTTGLRLLSDRKEKPFELPKLLLDVVAPGVDQEEIDTAVQQGVYGGVPVRNPTEAQLIIGTYQSAEIVRDNADVVLKASAPEIKMFGEGVRDLAKISAKTARELAKELVIATAVFGGRFAKNNKDKNLPSGE